MRPVPLRALRSIGRRQGFNPSPPEVGTTTASSSQEGAVLPAVSPASAARPVPVVASTVKIFRGSGAQFFRPYLPRAHQTLMLSGTSPMRYSFVRQCSSINEKDDTALEEEVEKKTGWLLKGIFIVTFALVGVEIFPYMGDNLLQQSIALLRVKDPLFKRMGASRLARFAYDDERRMRVVEMGGAQELLNMLRTAKDDKTRKQALRTLFSLSHSDEAAEALHQGGAVAIISSIPNSLEYAEVETYKSGLLKRFHELGYQIPSEVEVI